MSACDIALCECGYYMELKKTGEDKPLFHKLLINKYSCEYLPNYHSNLYTCKISGECKYDTMWDDDLPKFMDDHGIILYNMKLREQYDYGGKMLLSMDFGGDRKLRIPDYMIGFVNPEYDKKHVDDMTQEIFNENVFDEIGTAANFVMQGNYSCSICGGEYDAVSREICSSHIKKCIAENVKCQRRSEYNS